MRSILLAAAAAAALGIGTVSLPPAFAKAGGAGPKVGGGFKSVGAFKSGGGFKHGGAFKSGSHFKHGFPGKGFAYGFHHGKRLHHARRFHRPLFAFGLPAISVVWAPIVARQIVSPPPPEPMPPRVAEAKIYTVGTDGGCRSERVNVPQGLVTVWRC